jgi:hypothetical protein
MSTERTDDPLIAQKEEAELDAQRASRAANLFDIRRMIGGLFLIYGVILTILGITASEADKEKAAGINLNLWVGLGMLITAAIFLLWAFTRPLSQQLDEDDDGDDEAAERRRSEDRSVKGAHAPVGPDAAALGGSETTRRRPRDDRNRR